VLIIEDLENTENHILHITYIKLLLDCQKCDCMPRAGFMLFHTNPRFLVNFGLFLFHWKCGPVLIFTAKLINEKKSSDFPFITSKHPLFMSQLPFEQYKDDFQIN
jgi:hypothetical protein